MNQLHEITGSITDIQAEAIIHAVNEPLVPTPEDLPPLGICQYQVTSGQLLSCSHFIHTRIPLWEAEDPYRQEALARCYQVTLEAARRLGCRSAALPILGSDAGGFPGALALQIARQEIRRFLASQPGMDICLVIRESQADSYVQSLATCQDIRDYIARRMEDTLPPFHGSSPDREVLESESLNLEDFDPQVFSQESWDPWLEDGECSVLPMSPCPEEAREMPSWEPDYERTSRPLPRSLPKAKKASPPSFLGSLMNLLTSRNLPVREEADWFRDQDESFSEMLLRLIDEGGMTDAQCYNKAGVDRRVFSRLRSGVDSQGRPYQPSKPTVLAFAVALELSLDTTNELLRKAGYALSPCYKFDIIVEYFIRNRIYNLYEINLMLYEFDQPLLGTKAVC